VSKVALRVDGSVVSRDGIQQAGKDATDVEGFARSLEENRGVSTDYQSLDLSLSEECVADPARGQPNFPNSMSIGDCALALRHSTIIFFTRTQGHCNQHGMGESIMG
jgi:hypothetical protein